MRKKLFAICVFLWLTIISIASIMPARGVGQGEWILRYRVENSDTGQLIMDRDFQTGATGNYTSIIEGAELKVTFTINVSMTAPNTLKITTSMSHSSVEDRYWQLESQDYPLVNYNPNQQSVQFTQTKGSLIMSCFGKIPTGVVAKSVDGVVLHKAVPFALISLTGPSGEALDQIKPSITDAKVDEYQNLLKQKEEKLQSLQGSGVAAGYVQLFENVVEQAKAEGDQGFVDNAIALLNGLNVSNEPASSIMEMIFLPAMGVLGAVAVAFGFLFLRARGKIGYVLTVLEDQIKDLEGLTLRASKIDRTFSSSLESVKDRLKSLVGM